MILTPEQRSVLEQITEDVDAHLDSYVEGYVNHIVKQQKGASKLAKMNRLNTECLDTDIEEMIVVLDVRKIKEEEKKK